MKGEVLISNRIIHYEFEHKRVKNLNLRIRQDGTVYMSAPRFVSQKNAEKFLIDKGAFVIKGIDSLKNRKTESCRDFNSSFDSVFTILGEKKTLDEVKELLGINTDDKEAFIKAYELYRRKTIISIVNKMCEEVYPYFKIRTGREYPEIKFRQMKSRWGVCMPNKNSITFSYNLFETPIECIKYVVCHEFTHFLVPNHSDKFYRELVKTYPRYSEARKILRQFSI